MNGGSSLAERQQSGCLVEFLVFNLAVGRYRHYSRNVRYININVFSEDYRNMQAFLKFSFKPVTNGLHLLPYFLFFQTHHPTMISSRVCGVQKLEESEQDLGDLKLTATRVNTFFSSESS